MKIQSAIAGICMLFAGAATAQSAPAYVEVENDATMVPGFGMNVDQFEELDVYSAAGERIGDVEDVLADSSGKVVAVVVDYGGFLGVGEREAVFTLDQLQLKDRKLVTSMTKAQLEALPAWKK